MSRQEAETGSPASEYLTVPELAKMVRRNRKTVYGWIATGEIGEADGLFVVQGRFLIHWRVGASLGRKPAPLLRAGGAGRNRDSPFRLCRHARRPCDDSAGRAYLRPLGSR